MLIKKSIFVSVLFLVLFFPACFLSNASAVQQTETEKMLRTITPPLSVVQQQPEKKDQWYFDSYYEPNLVIEGNKTGRWDELTNTFGYIHQNVQGYFDVSQYDRLGNNDYTANFGSYINFKDSSYVHMETGFGWDVNYVYNFQALGEYGHKLIKDVFWQIGYNYRAYHNAGDVHNVYPGLIYYFGDNYLSANYQASFIESRDTASMGIFKGSFAITQFLRYYAGIAFGQRPYDILGIQAYKETGYILFTGLNLNLYKGISCRVGYSYGTETPKFVKHGMNCGLNVKF